jgi:hypothetical protein
MSAIDAYQRNDRYAGLAFFAFELNNTLARRLPKTPDIDQAITELDLTIKHSLSINSTAGDITLYRGCTFEAENPEIRNQRVLFRQYLSTSTKLSEALHFASKCDSRDGEIHVLKVIYPSSQSHFLMGENSEEEVLLPRDCSFTITEWSLTDEEQGVWDLCSSLRSSPTVKCLNYFPPPL